MQGIVLFMVQVRQYAGAEAPRTLSAPRGRRSTARVVTGGVRLVV